MITRSRAALAGVVAVGLFLGGCATTSAGHAEPAAGFAALTSQTAATPDTAAAGANEFAQKVAAGMLTVSSMQGTMKISGTVSAAATFKETVASGKVKAADIDMALKISGQSVQMRMLLVGSKAYIGGALLTMLGDSIDGKKWLALDPNSADPNLAQLGKQLGSLTSMGNMADQYVLVAKAITSIRTVGTEHVAGVDATHYTSIVNVQKMAAVLPPSMRTSAAQLEQFGLKELPVDYWLDDQGRMVQFTEKVTAAGQTGSASMTINKYNEPLTITAPDPSTVYSG